jgi:hypothetical protein
LLLCDRFRAAASDLRCLETALVLKRCRLLARRLVLIEVDCRREIEANILFNPGSRVRPLKLGGRGWDGS